MIKQSKTKYTLIIISAFLILICIVIPLAFSEDFISDFSALITASCSVITLIVAIILFDKYGIEHTIKDKNFRAVNDLMEDILKMNVSVRVINNESSNNLCVCHLFNIDFQSNYIHRIEDLSADHQSSQLFFTSSAINELSEVLSKGQRNLYMPPSIVEKIKLLGFDCFLSTHADKMPNILYCVFDTQYHENLQELYTPEDMTTLYNYFESLDELKKSCVQWLLENGGDGSINDTPYYY